MAEKVISVRVMGATKLGRRWLKSAKQLKSKMPVFLVELGQKFISSFRQKQLSGRPGVKKESGDLQNSFTAKSSGVGKGFALSISTSSPYFKTHSTSPGLRIFPRNKQALIIPDMTTPAGSTARLKYRHTPLPVGQYEIRPGTNKLEEASTGQLSHTLVPSVFIPKRIDVGSFTKDFFKNEMAPALRDFIVGMLKNG